MHTNPVVIPDIVSMAKGINGAWLPLGCVASRDHIADYFRKNAIGIGSTYNSHPVSLASAYSALQWMLKNRVVEHVQKMEVVMKREMEKLASKHSCVKVNKKYQK
jgi:taurine--2-oxoglutarate transaminase